MGMHSVRTELSVYHKPKFEKYLHEVLDTKCVVGEYKQVQHDWTYFDGLCYAYSDRELETAETISATILAHKSVENGFRKWAKIKP